MRSLVKGIAGQASFFLASKQHLKVQCPEEMNIYLTAIKHTEVVTL